MEPSDNSIPPPEQKKTWVKFDEDSAPEPQPRSAPGDASAAIISAETTQISIDKNAKLDSGDGAMGRAPAVITPESVHINVNRPSVGRSGIDPAPALSPSKVPDPSKTGSLKNVDLHDTANGRPLPALTNSGGMTTVSNAVIRQGFANGDIIVTLLPVNTKWPWITPAQFRPGLVPEELMAQGLTLTVEDYVHVMELLTNDIRFNLYNICYKRILVLWIFTAFVVLLGLLFSGITGLTLFGLGVMWLVLNAVAIFFCMWIKIKLNHNLEKCLGHVNKQLLKHKIILGLDDRGKISCHKVNLCFIYFDTTDCINKLQEVIEREEREGRPVNREETAEERHNRIQFQQRMDIDDSDIIIQGVNTTRLPRKQERAEMLYLRYSSRWVRHFLRNLLELSVDGSDPGSYPRLPPRHCISARCPCQFIEEHLKYKPREMSSLTVVTNQLYYRDGLPICI